MKKGYSKIRAGVVGVGYLGRFHAAKYAQSPQAELAAVVDILPERARSAARQFTTKDFTHYAQIYDLVDAVSIVTPTQCHYDIAKDFLGRGIDVLLEKPMTVTVDQADDLIQRASKNNCILQVGHLERFNPAIQNVKEILNSPLFFESHRLSPFSARGTDVDVVLDLMIHDIDIIMHFSGSEVVMIDAVGIPVLSPLIDIATVRLRFANGSMANLTASRISDKKMRKIRIFQSDAYLSVDYVKREVLIYRKGVGESPDGIPLVVADKRIIPAADSLQQQIEAFLRSVAMRTPPEVSGLDGRRALDAAIRIIENIRETAAWAKRARGVFALTAPKIDSGA